MFHFSYLYLLVLRVQGVVYVAKIVIFSVILYIMASVCAMIMVK